MPNASSIKTLPFIVLSVIAFDLLFRLVPRRRPRSMRRKDWFSGDIDEGISQLKALAAEGDVDAMLELAHIYIDEWSVAVDVEAAVRYPQRHETGARRAQSCIYHERFSGG